jgi:filamentous hemagglutinin family protein
MVNKGFFGYLIATCILSSANVALAQNVTSSNVNNLNTYVTHTGNQYNITGGTQAGSNLFYSLQKLGLSTGEIANFLTNTSVQNILTRVTGGEASVINGLIQVTGGTSNLFIMNPAGIVFGAKASLNVPSNFSATTANAIRVGDAWFGMNSSIDQVRNLTGSPNGYAFSGTLPNNTTPTPLGVIVNEGNLNVSNGKSVTLLGGLVVNTGTISTPEGKVTITATPDNKFIKIANEGNVLSYDLPISDRSAIGATSILRGVDLPKLLTGKTAGTAVVSGNLNVSGNQGGDIQVFGDNVNLANANINASGINGGGTVLIGGNYQGAGTTPTAQFTNVDQNSRINADALTNGNGGKVIVWSDNTTRFDGEVSARGGTQNGNGGFTEVSGKQKLTYSGLVDLRASKGVTGNLLLDPANFVIANIGGDITPATVVTQWNAANTTYSATNSLTVSNAIAANSANTLTLDAPTINLNAGITNTGAGAILGTANIVNVGTNGTVKNGVDVASNGATVNLASSTYTLGATIAINKNLSINGTTATVISGNNAVGVFNIGNNATLNINNLTIANGKASGNPSFGGGVFVNNGATLNLINSNLSNNVADYGAAIYNSGTVSINNSTLSGNTSVQSGGAIYNDGTITINSSTLSGNSAQNNNGGAVINGSASSNLNISNSTFSGNTSQNGGAIYNFTGTTTIGNSTFFGNSANQEGGAIANDGSMGASGNVTVNNSIIVGNNALTGKEISNNSILNFTGTNIVGTNGVNGISNTATLTGVSTTPTGAANTVINTTLASNGGLTKTHALVNGSIAINASNGLSTGFDQRGVLALGIRDVGAFEFLPTSTPSTPPNPSFDPNKIFIFHHQFFRPYINFKLFRVWRSSPVAFLSLDDIEFQQFDKFIAIIVNLMNKDGGTVTILADDIWKDTNMKIFEYSHNQEVIRLSMRRSMNKLIGSEYLKLININFEDKNDQKVILVKVRKSSRPVKFLSNHVKYAND